MVIYIGNVNDGAYAPFSKKILSNSLYPCGREKVLKNKKINLILDAPTSKPAHPPYINAFFAF